MKRNVPVFGLIIGLILPVLGTLIASYVFARIGITDFSGYIHYLSSNHDLAAKVCSLGLLINLIPFIFYTSRRLDLTARGILVATVLYFVFIILLKFVW
jgi:hypothetical protein